jgi:hypothetical protein
MFSTTYRKESQVLGTIIVFGLGETGKSYEDTKS